MLVRGQRAVQAALGRPQVADRDAAAQDVGDVAGALQPDDRLRVAVVRAREVPDGPESEPGQRRRRGPGEVVVRLRQLPRLLGVRDGAVDVAGRRAPGRRGTSPPGRAAPEPLDVDDDGAGRRLGRPRGADAVLPPRSQQVVDGVEPAGMLSNSDTCASAPTRYTPSTGRTRTTSSGSSRTQPRSTDSCRVRAGSAIRQLDQVGRPGEVLGREGVLDRLGRLAVSANQALARRCSSATSAGLLLAEVRPQHVGEQVVVAVPLAPVVERRRGTGWPGRGRSSMACRRRRPVTASHSGPVSRSRTEVCSRKSRTSLGLALQHLLGEVVDDVAVVARRSPR